MQKVIGIGGLKKSGKNAVADILVRDHGYVLFAWADTLKGACRLVFGFTEEQVNGDLKEIVDAFWGLTPREVMQKVGTEGFRAIWEDIWVRALLRRIAGVPRVVITDCRFPNELAAVRALGGRVWLVDRKGLQLDVDGHSSEQLAARNVAAHRLGTCSDFDTVIENYGGLDHLRERVQVALRTAWDQA